MMTIRQPDIPSHNWSKHIQFQAAAYHCPETIEQLQQIVRSAAKVRVVGAGHSFNDLADTPDTLISLDRLDKTVSFDHTRHTATVNAGINYITLAPILHQAGYALPNLASLPHITVIGAAATATHGSGDRLGNLATHISGLEILKADGELVQLSKENDADRFEGAVVALGGLGIVTKVTLDLAPAFTMRQQVYQNLPLADMVRHFDTIMGQGYSVSLFTAWQNKLVDQVWVKQLLPDDQALPLETTLFGATLATTDQPPVEGSFTTGLTPQRGVPGPWYERLPHFHLQSTLTGGDELQTEYFVPREHAVEALLTVESLNEQMAPFLKICEVRSVAADKLWLSTAYRQDCIGIHFSWFSRWAAVSQFLPVLEARLLPFRARPHWGKLFTMPPEQVSAHYDKMSNFRTLLADFDPQGKFSNAYLERYIHNRTPPASPG
jgi:xylitol oxidase